MRALRHWRVDLTVLEVDGRTQAEAILFTDIGSRGRGVGRADLSPDDYDVPEIGDELAVARALRRLSDGLLGVASGDIEAMTGEHVRISH